MEKILKNIGNNENLRIEPFLELVKSQEIQPKQRDSSSRDPDGTAVRSRDTLVEWADLHLKLGSVRLIWMDLLPNCRCKFDK